jgi:hypothetical protein
MAGVWELTRVWERAEFLVNGVHPVMVLGKLGQKVQVGRRLRITVGHKTFRVMLHLRPAEFLGASRTAVPRYRLGAIADVQRQGNPTAAASAMERGIQQALWRAGKWELSQ